MNALEVEAGPALLMYVTIDQFSRKMAHAKSAQITRLQTNRQKDVIS